MTLRCADCGALTGEEEAPMTRRGYLTGRVCCPRCGSEDVEAVSPCGNCGLLTAEEELEEGLCPACAGRALRLARSMLLEYFSEGELRLFRAQGIEF